MTITSVSEYISTRQVGEATISVISMMACAIDMEYGVPLAALQAIAPDTNDRGEMPGGMNAVHIKTGEYSILIDPGFDEPDSATTARILEAFPDWQPTAGLVNGLAEIGVQPETVTHVLLTHAHFDHTLGLVSGHDSGDLQPRFPNARHYVGAAEPIVFKDHEELVIDPDWHIFRQMTAFCHGELQVINKAGLLEFVEGVYEVIPGLTMIPTPGESAGHYAVRLDTGEETFWFLGDLVHHGCEFERTEWVMGGNRDLEAMAASREQIMPDLAQDNVTAVFAHGLFPGWGRLVRDGDGYQWQYLGEG